jgi:hypothetical protein
VRSAGLTAGSTRLPTATDRSTTREQKGRGSCRWLGTASETADGYDESEYEWSATYTYSDPKPVDPHVYYLSGYDSSGSDAGGWQAVSGTASSSASGAHNSSWSVSTGSSAGLGPLQLSATFNGSGRQTSAYGKWTSSTISDSGTWVTTGTGVSTDSSTLSLSFSGGVTLGEGGPGVSVSGSHERASRSTAATAYNAEKGWHTTSGSRSQSGSGSGNVGTTAGYGIVGGSGAGFSYEFSLNSTSGPSGTSSTSGSASATLSWSGTGDTGHAGSGITARARYGDGDGWQIVSVGPATAAGPGGVPGAGDLGTAAAGDSYHGTDAQAAQEGVTKAGTPPNQASPAWAGFVGFFQGLGQGGLNIANGLQDMVIGVANLPAAGVNGIAWLEEMAGILDPSQPLRVPYIPSPDWSRGWLTHEGGEEGTWSDTHGWSKFAGATGVTFWVAASRVGSSPTALGNARLGWKGGEVTFTRPGTRTPDVRINPFGGSGYPPHYHRRPGIGKHRPWEGGW